MADDRDAHLGTGLTFPLRVNLQGGIQLSARTRSVEESIWLILRTELGERVYRPDFGSRLSQLTFAPMNSQTLLLLRLYVQEALEKWEPRIHLENVRTAPDSVRGRVTITIDYRLQETYELQSMVYPFYLIPPDSSPDDLEPSNL